MELLRRFLGLSPVFKAIEEEKVVGMVHGLCHYSPPPHEVDNFEEVFELVC